MFHATCAALHTLRRWSSRVDWRGRIDVLMYVAGIAPAVSFVGISDETLDKTADTNLRGAFVVSKAVAPHMVTRKRSKLVFHGITNCWDAETSLAHYNVSKAGAFLLAKTLARKLGPHRVNSNALGRGSSRLV